MFCVKCGMKLEQGKCPSCGFEDGTAGQSTTNESSKYLNETLGSGLDSSAPQNITRQEQKAGGSKKKLFVKKEKEKKPKQKKQKVQNAEEKRYKEKKLKKLLKPKINDKPLKEENQAGKISKEKEPWSKKKKVTFAAILASALVVVGVGGFLTFYFIKDAKYQEAISYLEKDKPKKAAAEFEELGRFKDSEDYLEEANTLIAYYQAIDTYEEKDYETALVQFDELGNYEDSGSYAELCRSYIKYNDAYSLYSSGSFEQAKVIFVSLGNFEDSIDMSGVCQVNMDYEEAQKLFSAEDYAGAMTLFTGIEDFKDSNDMVLACDCLIDYNNALDYYNRGQYVSAEKLLRSVEADAADLRIDISGLVTKSQIEYYRGQCFYKQGLYYSAYQAFTASSFEDAGYMVSKCKQPFETKEYYENPSYDRNSVKFTTYAPKEGGYSACVKVYTESGVHISTFVVKYKEKLKIYLPSGTYYFDVSFGKEWFGEKEAFGTGFERTGPDKLSTSYYYTWEL